MMCSPSAVLGFSHTIKHCVTEAIAGANLFIFGVFAAAIVVRWLFVLYDASSKLLRFTQAAPSTAPTSPPPTSPPDMSPGAAVTQGFPRIGVYLTAKAPHRPASPHLKSSWEGEVARKEDKGNAISTSPVWLDELLKEEKKRANLMQCGRDYCSWDLQLRPGAGWVETGLLRIQPQLYPLT